MNPFKTIEHLHFYNPWWVTKKVPPSLSMPYRRHVFDAILSYLNIDRIVVLKGPRRTGKTTLMYQLIDSLIEEGVNPNHLIYISFDEAELRTGIDSIIKAVEQILKMPVKSWQTIYFFLDEVHYLDGWEFQVKKYFDRKLPLKFIVSSSASSLLKKATESLMGRTIEEVILPFSFCEFLDLKSSSAMLSTMIKEVRRNEKIPLSLPDISTLVPYLSEIEIFFAEYKERGGFPYLFHISEPILWKRMLKEDIVDKVLYRDLTQLFGIKKPVTLEKLFLYLTGMSSGILNISNIANSLQLSREYTEKYLEYLKRAYLIFALRKYTASIEKRIRSNEKVYVVDHGLINAFGHIQEGTILENIVFRYLYNLKMPLYYWRDKHEVDFVIETEYGIVPVEVKDTDALSKKDIKGITEFMEIYRADKGIVITRGLLKKERIDGKTVLFIPGILLS